MSREIQMKTPPSDGRDAVFLQSRRELIGILLIWAGLALWVVIGAGALGYRETAGEVDMVWGIPAWVFWAIGVPWLISNTVIFWFCTGFMKDQPLDPVEGESTEMDRNR